jgi:hypothetical protein
MLYRINAGVYKSVNTHFINKRQEDIRNRTGLRTVVCPSKYLNGYVSIYIDKVFDDLEIAKAIIILLKMNHINSYIDQYTEGACG